ELACPGLREALADQVQGALVLVEPRLALRDDAGEAEHDFILPLLDENGPVRERLPERDAPLGVGLLGEGRVPGHDSSIAHFPTMVKWDCGNEGARRGRESAHFDRPAGIANKL